MFISWHCLAWNNPIELGRLVACFERQTHEARELICLDDGGQFPAARDDRHLQVGPPESPVTHALSVTEKNCWRKEISP